MGSCQCGLLLFKTVEHLCKNFVKPQRPFFLHACTLCPVRLFRSWVVDVVVNRTLIWPIVVGIKWDTFALLAYLQKNQNHYRKKNGTSLSFPTTTTSRKANWRTKVRCIFVYYLLHVYNKHELTTGLVLWSKVTPHTRRPIHNPIVQFDIFVHQGLIITNRKNLARIRGICSTQLLWVRFFKYAALLSRRDTTSDCRTFFQKNFLRKLIKYVFSLQQDSWLIFSNIEQPSSFHQCFVFEPKLFEAKKVQSIQVNLNSHWPVYEAILLKRC